ncbi:MAG: hypothetical protein VKK63_00665 [Synechococcus sp.]|nr:hypothetical protein [Synechococcus sp.]
MQVLYQAKPIATKRVRAFLRVVLRQTVRQVVDALQTDRRMPQ